MTRAEKSKGVATSSVSRPIGPHSRAIAAGIRLLARDET